MQEKPSFSNFAAIRPKAVTVSQAAMVRTSYLDHDRKFPLVVEPAMDGVNLGTWAGANREWIEKQRLAIGAILFRNFGIDTVEQFQKVTRAMCQDLLDYNERAAPRHEVGKNVYTSTEFPSNQIIPLHHEMSYSHNWPTKLWFYCDQPAITGGRTPVADDRKVFQRIDPKIRERFAERKVMYVRNYGEGVDMTWREAFQTDDRAKVEEYCRRAGATVEWKDGDRLRTRSVRRAVLADPRTGENLWFNHAHMFHVSNLEPAVREALLAQFAEDDLPRNAFYGDGTPIESSILEGIRGLYEEEAVRFEWRRGDILMVDNFLVTHGREPFVGPRRILVAMGELFDSVAAFGS